MSRVGRALIHIVVGERVKEAGASCLGGRSRLFISRKDLGERKNILGKYHEILRVVLRSFACTSYTSFNYARDLMEYLSEEGQMGVDCPLPTKHTQSGRV